MNTTLLIQQLTVAIIVSAIVVPTVQRIKAWFPSAKWVEAISAIIAVVLGIIMARYYAGYDWPASCWVGFYSLIGAEAAYKLVAEKLTTYSEQKGLWETTDISTAEIEHVLNEEAGDPDGEN